MALTADVKDELARIDVSKTTVRAAELATILRFSGGLHLISGRIAVESELDTAQLARRVRKDLAELYGVRSEISVISASGLRRTSHYLVRVLDGGETLARQTGLLDARRRPIRGLPNQLTTGQPRRARRRLARSIPRPRLPHRPRPLRGARGHLPRQRVGNGPRRGGRAAEDLREGPRGARRAPRRDPRRRGDQRDARAHGRRDSVLNWEELRQRREVRATANRLVNFDDANLRRSAQAAVAACARVERALEILDDDVPEHLRYAGELRLRFRDSSLDELGHHADPPMTKDAVAGRIRRLLAMADKRAVRPRNPRHRAPTRICRRTTRMPEPIARRWEASGNQPS